MSVRCLFSIPPLPVSVTMELELVDLVFGRDGTLDSWFPMLVCLLMLTTNAPPESSIEPAALSAPRGLAMLVVLLRREFCFFFMVLDRADVSPLRSKRYRMAATRQGLTLVHFSAQS